MWLFSGVWSLECGVWKKIVSKLRIFTLYTLHSTLIFLTTACGFQPVYGNSSAVSQNAPLLAGIKVSAVDGATMVSSVNTAAPTGVSRQFKENLEDLLEPATLGKEAKYKLDVSLSQSATGVGISRDGTASRYDLIITSTYTLTRLSDNKLLDRGAIRNIASYNNPSNQYFSTYISEQDARKRGVAELAQLYRQRLTALTENSEPPAIKLAPNQLLNPIMNQNYNNILNQDYNPNYENSTQGNR